MAKDIIRDQGLFWWNDKAVPEGHFAPPDAVGGTLLIDKDGLASLEVHGFLEEPESPFGHLAATREEIDCERPIQGILKGDGRHILLMKVWRDGGSARSGGISFERFKAPRSLVGPQCLADASSSASRALTLPLDGLETWLWDGPIKVLREKDLLSADGTTPPDYSYSRGDARLTLEHSIESSQSGSQLYEVQLKATARLNYTKTTLMEIEEVEETFRYINDLFMLLTGAPVTLKWPIVEDPKGEQRTLFHWRISPERPTLSWSDLWTFYPDVKDVFGPIVFNWLEKRQQFGPAFYLFLGCKRQKGMFAEHKFVNLAWAIEAFSRTTESDPPVQKLSERIDRILAAITDTKDKEWLKSRLKHAAEPNLEQRMFTVLKELPLEIQGLRQFCSRCASLRNEVSHFGGPRQRPYDAFMQELRKYTEAFERIYHFRLLQEVGVPHEALESTAFRRGTSFLIRYWFIETGLVDPEWRKVRRSPRS